MTTRTSHISRCDDPSCAMVRISQSGVNKREWQQILSGEGWSIGRRFDFCPEHRPAPQNQHTKEQLEQGDV